MMFKLKHKLPAMVGMAACLVFGAENAAAEIDARFADEASFRTYFRGLTTQYDKDWALAAAVVYCKPELAKIALDGGASINTTVEQVGYKYFGFDKGRWLFINGEETLAPLPYVYRGVVVTGRGDLKDYYAYLEDYKEKLARYELSYDGNSMNPKLWMLPDEGFSYGEKTLLGTCGSKAMTKLLLDYGADASTDGAAAQQDKYRRYKKPVVQNALPKTARKLKSPRELPSVEEMYELHKKAEHGGRKAETSFLAPGAEQPSAGKGTAASTADGNNAAAESAGGGREIPAEEVEEQILLF